MGIYKHIKKTWETPKDTLGDLWRERLILWRREPVTNRIERPTRLDKARALGYRAKQGILVIRQRVKRGGHTRPDWAGGRHSSNMGIVKNLRMNYQWIAEQRANKPYRNCEVLNSYYVGEDGKHLWYEVILADKTHPAILADPQLKWVASPANRGRVYRGLTHAARISRGLMSKGIGAEKVRPSRHANRS